MRLKLLALALSVAVTAKGEVGAYSYMALCHPTWPCDKSLAPFASKEVIQFGWLGTTFGKKCSCLNRFLKAKKPKVFRVHLLNGPCLRNRRCGSYEPLAHETIASATEKLRSGNRLLLGKIRDSFRATAFHVNRGVASGARCYVSPCLECDFPKDVRKTLRRLAKRYFPNCTFVDNPHKDSCLSDAVCEKHGNAPKLRPLCIADPDGSVVDNDAFVEKYRKCEMQFRWHPRYNCNEMTGSFIDPRKRDCKYVWRNYVR